MAVKVTVPNKNYSALYFGVRFTNGVAIFEDEEKGRAIAGRLGYQVEPVEDAVEAPAEEPEKAEDPVAEVTEEPVEAEIPAEPVKPKRTRRKKAEVGAEA